MILSKKKTLLFQRLVFLKGLCLDEDDDDHFIPRKLFMFRIDNLQKISRAFTCTSLFLFNFMQITFVRFFGFEFFLRFLSTKTLGLSLIKQDN